jgi:hypothetical protein
LPAKPQTKNWPQNAQNAQNIQKLKSLKMFFAPFVPFCGEKILCCLVFTDGATRQPLCPPIPCAWLLLFVLFDAFLGLLFLRGFSRCCFGCFLTVHTFGHDLCSLSSRLAARLYDLHYSMTGARVTFIPAGPACPASAYLAHLEKPPLDLIPAQAGEGLRRS